MNSRRPDLTTRQRAAELHRAAVHTSVLACRALGFMFVQIAADLNAGRDAGVPSSVL